VKPRFLIAATVGLLFFAVASHIGTWLFLAVGIPALIVIHVRASRSLRRRVEEKSRGLRQLPFETLAVIKCPAEFSLNGAVHVRVDRSALDTLRILVQGSEDVLFYRLGRSDGFHVTREGTVRPMDSAEYEALEAEYDALDEELEPPEPGRLE
jgi:hypothetical protein